MNYIRNDLLDVDFESISKTMIYATSISEEIAEFRWSHTNRVIQIALLLAEGDTCDTRKLILACTIHDMFKYASNDKRYHADMAANWLQDLVNQFYDPLNKECIEERYEWALVVDAIRNHSYKKYCNDNNVYARILLDADTLDKINVDYVKGYRRLFLPDITIFEAIEHFGSKISGYVGHTNKYNEIKQRMFEKLEKELL